MCVFVLGHKLEYYNSPYYNVYLTRILLRRKHDSYLFPCIIKIRNYYRDSLFWFCRAIKPNLGTFSRLLKILKQFEATRES